jgi:hypothetical protein
MANQSTIPVLAASGANVWIGMVAGSLAAGLAGAALAFPARLSRCRSRTSRFGLHDSSLRRVGRADRVILSFRQPARELRESKRN